MRTRLIAATLGLTAVALAGLFYVGYRLIPLPPARERDIVPLTTSTPVVAAPTGHAYRYIAARNITWAQARDAAATLRWHGKPGYLATLDDEAEYRFVIDHVFAHAYSDVTYLGGRKTGHGEWRWVTGPDAAADGGKGRLFWRGDDQGSPVAGGYANWMASAFQHGGKWDLARVCCVTLFSYGMPQFSTSLGNGEPLEGVAGYLVEFGD